eukprot:15001550-Alexandrium_andersonii.AAC.1
MVMVVEYAVVGGYAGFIVVRMVVNGSGGVYLGVQVKKGRRMVVGDGGGGRFGEWSVGCWLKVMAWCGWWWR